MPDLLKLDPDVVERLRADGAAWQTRINAALRKAAGFGNEGAAGSCHRNLRLNIRAGRAKECEWGNTCFIRKAELGALLLSAGILFAGAISAMPR